MKRYFYGLVMVSMISGLTAMDDSSSLEAGDAPPSLQESEVLDSSVVVESFMDNPDNVEVKSGLFGFGSSMTYVKADAFTAFTEEQVRKQNNLQRENDLLRGLLEKQDDIEKQNKELLAQLQELQELKQANAVLAGQLDLVKGQMFNVTAAQRALQEAQDARDAEAKRVAELEERLRAQKSESLAKDAAYNEVIKEKVQWLEEADKYRLEQNQQKARGEALAKENETLKETIQELKVAYDQLKTSKAELDSYSKALEAEKNKGAEANDQRCQSLEEAIANKTREVRAKEEENEKLKTEQKRSETLIENLRRAQTGSNYYEQILTKTKDRSVSDDELVKYMVGVSVFLGVDLDKLSENKDVSLVEAIIDVSCPLGPRPSDAKRAYNNCWRLIGNQLLGKGQVLVWTGGHSFNAKECRFKGSDFEQTLQNAALAINNAILVK